MKDGLVEVQRAEKEVNEETQILRLEVWNFVFRIGKGSTYISL